ncbi:hypothetical protein TrRE_jg2722 [Triparma retinervis]|uniref:ODAD1 central coiled coil region domain-containing protein n=1 Tax=Triparma retinervis TaxID=2557542 RepID=A0A9W7C9B5_9STRA|nr:hypothetical protein TrRE_jg2722 [Triparma retinervis]
MAGGNSTDELFKFADTPRPGAGYSPKKPTSDAPPTKSPRGGNPSLLEDLRTNMEQSKADDLAGKSLFNPEGTTTTQSNQLAARVDYVCEQQIHYTKKIEAERRRLADVEKRIARAKTAIVQRRKQIAQASKDRKMSVSAVRNLGKLENKLQQLLIKNNLMEKDNVRKKKQVDDLRKEKIQQVQVTQKFERTLSGKKAKVALLVTETQQLQDKKDKVLREIEVMKQKILDELDANNDEYNALKAELSMNQMGAEEKLTPDQLALEKKKREALKKQMQKNEGTLSAEEEEHIVSNINKAYWAIAKKKMDIQKQADKIHELVDDFKYLSEQTGVTSVETLIPILLSSEEENFRLFDVTNEYNKELETLEVEKGELRSKINHYMKIEAKQEEGKSKIKREKQDQIETAKAHSSKADSKYNTDVEVIKKVAPSVTSIFNKVGCEDEAVSAVLLTAGVTDRSIMQYMAVIERRINEIVQLHNTTQKHGIISHFEGMIEDPTRPKTPLLDQTGKRVAALSQPILPSHGDFDDGDDDDGDDDVEPMQVSKLHDMVATQARASRLGGGGRSKLSIGFKGKASNASLRSKGSRRSLKSLKHL